MTSPGPFKDKDGNWLEPEFWPLKQMIVTCRNPSCPSYGREESVSVTDNVDGITRVVCRCGSIPQVKNSPPRHRG